MNSFCGRIFAGTVVLLQGHIVLYDSVSNRDRRFFSATKHSDLVLLEQMMASGELKLIKKSVIC